jgi:SulP family sulfate permease
MVPYGASANFIALVAVKSKVVGVTVPDGRFVPHGSIIDSMDKVDALPMVSDAQHHFNADVVDVNRGLAAAYRAAVSSGKKLPPTNAGPRHAWDEGWTVASGERF